MRILHLVGRSHRRGAEQVAMELATELDGRGHFNRLLAVSLGHRGEQQAGLDPLVAATAQGPTQLLRAARNLRRELRSEPIDVVLAHGAAAALVGVVASPRRGPVLVWQTIVAMDPQSFGGFQGVAWKVAVRRIDAVVALTRELGDEARRLGFDGPVWPIANARRTARFADLDRTLAGEALRAEVGAGPDRTLLGLVGYLVDQKQPVEAVEVAASLVAEGRDVHLVVAGSGPLETQVVERARELGVTDRVTLTGHRDDVPQVLAGLDVLVMTSRDEGIPGVVIEAAMAGCPVVTYPFDAALEVIDQDSTGLVVDTASVPALAGAVAGLLDDPARRRAMGEEARRRSARFDMARVAERYEHELSGLMAGRGSGPEAGLEVGGGTGRPHRPAGPS